MKKKKRKREDKKQVYCYIWPSKNSGLVFGFQFLVSITVRLLLYIHIFVYLETALVETKNSVESTNGKHLGNLRNVLLARFILLLFARIGILELYYLF